MKTIHILCISISILINQIVFSETKLHVGTRDFRFDNTNFADTAFLVKEATHELACFRSCVKHELCRSVSYNVERSECHHFVEDFSKKTVSGVMQAHWHYYNSEYYEF